MKLSAQKLSPKELKDVRTLLLSEGLPVETILNAPIVFYQLVTETGARIGWGGIEVHGSHGVLRAVLIKSALRKTGAGRTLVKAIIDDAKNSGIKKLWLLTTNAEVFFAKMGFNHAIRDDAPKDIKDCEEFTWPHHDTAHCMNMRIG
jgi:amino-acid N-acetyltransferase